MSSGPERFDAYVRQSDICQPIGSSVGAPCYEVAANQSVALHREQVIEHIAILQQMFQVTVVHWENTLAQAGIYFVQDRMDKLLIERVHGCRFASPLSSRVSEQA
jgi:hypothetical protein